MLKKTTKSFHTIDKYTLFTTYWLEKSKLSVLVRLIISVFYVIFLFELSNKTMVNVDD